MKTLIVVLLFATSLHETGQTQQENCGDNCAQGSVQSKYVPRRPTINTLANTICSHYVGDATKVAKNIKRTLHSYMGKQEQIKNPTPEQTIQFLNKYKDQLLCGNTNYMVESFRHGAYDELFNIFFYEELLVEDEGLYVDINAISYTGGVTENEPETTLDYMYRRVQDKILTEQARGEIQYLIEMFEEYFNGKRFAELTDEEQAAAQRRKPN